MLRLFLLLFILPLWTKAQNLLVNGGFEEENICTEYSVNCAPEGWIYTVPSYFYYFKDNRAYAGQAYVGIIAGHARKSFYRSFVRSRLLCRLRKDKEYLLQFYVKSRHPILDSAGIYFSSHDILFEKRRPQTIQPSIYLADAIQRPSNRDTGWQKVVIRYKATGNETYIALGMYGKRDITGPTTIPRESNFFIFFDNISLTPTDVNEILCRDWEKNREQIYAQNERHEHQMKLMTVFRNAPPKMTPPPSTIVLKIDTLMIPDVFFATNSFVINKNAARLLDSFKRKIHTLDIDSIVIYGHTDAIGSDQANQELSWRRANSVGAYLQEATPAEILTRGMGSTKPVADNRSARGRQLNRRVEIFIYKKND